MNLTQARSRSPRVGVHTSPHTTPERGRSVGDTRNIRTRSELRLPETQRRVPGVNVTLNTLWGQHVVI